MGRFSLSSIAWGNLTIFNRPFPPDFSYWIFNTIPGSGSPLFPLFSCWFCFEHFILLRRSPEALESTQLIKTVLLFIFIFIFLDLSGFDLWLYMFHFWFSYIKKRSSKDEIRRFGLWGSAWICFLSSSQNTQEVEMLHSWSYNIVSGGNGRTCFSLSILYPAVGYWRSRPFTAFVFFGILFFCRLYPTPQMCAGERGRPPFDCQSRGSCDSS